MGSLSLSKRRLIQKLRNPRLRAKEGKFLVEGVRLVDEYLRASSPIRPRFSLMSSTLKETEAGSALWARLGTCSFPVEEIGEADFRAISDTRTPQGVLLVLDEPEVQLPRFSGNTPHQILLLDGLRDPGNAGTLIRGAWAFGLTHVVFLEGSVDPWSPKVVRAGAGGSFHVPVSRGAWEAIEAELRVAAVPVYVADAGGTDLREVSAAAPWALVLGNEAEGVRPEIRAGSAGTLAVPMASGVDSLNAGVAGAILLFSLAFPRDREREP